MNDHGMPVPTVRDCSGCGRPTVTSPLCVRPDLCFPCFGGYLQGGAG